MKFYSENLNRRSHLRCLGREDGNNKLDLKEAGYEDVVMVSSGPV
jgi:hypothetical protein